MVTVEADLVCVESRLAAGQISCPACSQGVLGGWGFARTRRVVGLAGAVRPRRARCAVNAAAAAIRQRFGPAGLVGAVTPAQVLVAVSGGRLLSPGWSWMR